MDATLEQRFTILEERFDRLEISLANVVTAMQKGFALLNIRMDGIDEHLTHVERRLGKVEVILIDIQDELTGHGRTIDKDAVTLINHEKRIKRLEKAQ